MAVFNVSKLDDKKLLEFCNIWSKQNIMEHLTLSAPNIFVASTPLPLSKHYVSNYTPKQEQQGAKRNCVSCMPGNLGRPGF